MNTDKPNRNPEKVLDKMIEALGSEYPDARAEFVRIKRDAPYRAPEVASITWGEMQEVLHDIVLAGTKQENFSDVQKNLIRIFTGNPDIV